MKCQNYFIAAISTLVLTLGLIYFQKEKNPYFYQAPVTGSENHRILNELNGEITFYRKRLLDDPTGYQNMALLAQYLLIRGKKTGQSQNFVEASQLANKSLKIMPYYNTSAIFVQADLAQAQHQFDEAIAKANLILKEKPHYPEALGLIASSLLAQGKLGEAQSFAEKRDNISRDQSTKTLLAVIYSGLGQDSIAERTFKEALALDEEDLEQASLTRAFYARHLIGKGDLTNASLLLEEAFRLDPHSPVCFEQWGELLEQRKEYPEAIAKYRDAFRKTPQLKFLFKEARIHKKLGKLENANALFTHTEALLRTELSMNASAHRGDLIELLIERGSNKDLREALELLDLEMKVRKNKETLTLYKVAREKIEGL